MSEKIIKKCVWWFFFLLIFFHIHMPLSIDHIGFAHLTFPTPGIWVGNRGSGKMVREFHNIKWFGNFSRPQFPTQISDPRGGGECQMCKAIKADLGYSQAKQETGKNNPVSVKLPNNMEIGGCISRKNTEPEQYTVKWHIFHFSSFNQVLIWQSFLHIFVTFSLIKNH